jgi:hypothetical protein
MTNKTKAVVWTLILLISLLFVVVLFVLFPMVWWKILSVVGFNVMVYSIYRIILNILND